MTKASPDWAALYQKHRDAMYRVAYAALRDKGLTHLADDAVNSAMVSLMQNPPEDVRNWEAMLVRTAKNRALDLLGSAAVSRGVELTETRDRSSEPADGTEILERLHKIERAKIVITQLGAREHHVFAEYLVLERNRADVAAELNVTPARVSQIATKITREIQAATEEGG